MTSDELSLRMYSRQGESHMDSAPAIRVCYGDENFTGDGQAVLAAIEFGPGADRRSTAPLSIKVRLEPLGNQSMTEYWLSQGQVLTGQSGLVRFAHDDHFLFAAIEVDEREYGGILDATEVVYTAIREFQRSSQFPHLQRMWNFMDAVNKGDGDLERYRQFCMGRAHGLAETRGERYPAATAIGRQLETNELQVFWLAGRTSGTAVENPRQISAYRYPRAHGPVSPSFSRATVTADGTLLISGTASIVGHVSVHHENPLAQFEETLRNLRVLIERAQPHRNVKSSVPILFKVYVRDPAHLGAIAARLHGAFPNDPAIFLSADICRRELLLEIECVIQAEQPR
jgi:chorismate lyase / 3-hydroxybenzoate synthase